MKCNKVKRKLSAYSDNELKEKEQRLISEHLKICENCKNEFVVLSRQDNFLSELETIIPSVDFKPDFWQKVRDAGRPVREPLGNLVAEKMRKWIPAPVFCAITICVFLIFSVVSPFLYGQDTKINEQITGLVKKTLIPSNQQKIFAPLNFVNFCNEYCQTLCEHCQSKTDLECGHRRCEK